MDRTSIVCDVQTARTVLDWSPRVLERLPAGRIDLWISVVNVARVPVVGTPFEADVIVERTAAGITFE